MAQKSLREFSISVVANVPTGPVVNLRDKNFKIRTGLITTVQASPFYGLPSEDANAHLQQFLELRDTIVIKDVTPEAIKLCLFPFSLVEKAKQWFYKDNAPLRSLPNSSPWAKPMLCEEGSPISSKHKWNPYLRHGRGCRSTSKHVPTTGWKAGWCSKVSTMG
jgi:hypothetical protein